MGAVVGDTLEYFEGEVSAFEMPKKFDNVDGKFQPSLPTFPGGSWVHSSRNWTRDGNVLCVECQRLDLTWNPVCISYEEEQAFENINGTLQLELCTPATTTATTTTTTL